MNKNSVALIEKACSGDMGAFQEFIRMNSSRVHAIAYQMVGNPVDAQDIAQEAFMRLFRKLRTYKAHYTFSTWLYRLTINISIDYLRKRSRNRCISLEEMEDGSHMKDIAPQPDSSLELAELKGAVQRISEGLTKNQRKVFVLRDLQGFSSAEVAQILKCRISTVRVHLSKAREHVRKALVEHDLSEQSGLSSQEGK